MRVDAVPQPAPLPSPLPLAADGEDRGGEEGPPEGDRAMTGGLGSRVFPFFISEGERPRRGPKWGLIGSLTSPGW